MMSPERKQVHRNWDSAKAILAAISIFMVMASLMVMTAARQSVNSDRPRGSWERSIQAEHDEATQRQIDRWEEFHGKKWDK